MMIAANLNAIWNDPIVLLATGVVAGIVVARWLSSHNSDSSPDRTSVASPSMSTRHERDSCVGQRKLGMLWAKHQGYVRAWESLDRHEEYDSEVIQDWMELVFSNLHEMLEVVAESPELERADGLSSAFTDLSSKLAMWEGQWLLGEKNAEEVITQLKTLNQESFLGG